MSDIKSKETEKKSEDIIVFVYGSLRKGCHNHKRHLKKSTFVGNARLPGFVMYKLCESYPGIVEGGDGEITVEAYKVTTEELENLDILEGHPKFYKRIEKYSEELKLTGWIYCIQSIDDDSHYGEISGGDWIKHLEEKKSKGKSKK